MNYIELPQQAGTAPVKIKLDWAGYFKEFCSLHGDPVKHAGRLLFQDGWSYSMTDYRGPEWMPPTDLKELNRLQVAYWEIRLGMVKTEAKTLQQTIEHVENLQKSYSAPIQVSTNYWSDEPTGKVLKTRRSTLSVEPFVFRLGWLNDDIARCESKLAELREPATTEPQHA